MSTRSIIRASITTDRLVLRPSDREDAARAFEIRADWAVSRMLRMATFPPDAAAIACWFEGHPREWTDGTAYRFAILRDGRMIGLVDIDGVGEREGVLGYWLERAAWGHGFAFEATTAALGFAFRSVGLAEITAAHAIDNQASAAVLRKLGFEPLGIVQRFSHSRRADIAQCRYILRFAEGA